MSLAALKGCSSPLRSRRPRAKHRRSRSKPSNVSSSKAAASLRSCEPPTKPFRSSEQLWRKLDPYQQDAVTFALKAKGCGLFFEQGTGKTWITAGLVERLLSPQFQAIIVVPLANIETTWAVMLAKVRGLHVARTLPDLLRAPFPRALLVHYEALPPLVQRARKRDWTLIVYDESQRLKERGTLTSRSANKLRNSATYRVCLSGTPIESHPKDLWAQFRFCAPHVFGTRWKDFEEEYLEPVDIDLAKYRPRSLRFARAMRQLQIKKRKRPFREDKRDQFMRAIAPHALRVTKDEVLDLPSLNLIPTPVTLRGGQRHLYQEIERDMVSSVLRLSAPLKVTQIGKLQQITGGYVFDDDGEVHEVGRAKLRKVKDLLREFDRQSRLPVVIFCKYTREVQALYDELRHNYPRIETLTGKVKKRDRAPILQRFQAGEVDVLICQVRTGGVGIDLYRSHTAIVYSTTHSYIDFEQLVSRLHRRGQEQEVSVFMLIANGTIDMAIFRALSRKRNASDRVLTYLRRKQHEQGKDCRRPQAGVQVHGRQPRRRSGHPAPVRSDRAAQARRREERQAIWLEQPEGLSGRPQEVEGR